MEPRLVAGLFRSSGTEEDARNSLKTEGVPASEVGLKVLKPAAPLLPTAEAELEGLSVDPLNCRRRSRDFCKVRPQWRNDGIRPSGYRRAS
jgi:hypothetical protein